MISSKLFLFSKEVHFNSGVRLLLELYCAILAKLTVVFICNSLPLNLCTSVFGCGCGFGFEQKFWRIDGFGEKKRHGSADLHTLLTPLIIAYEKKNKNKKEYFFAVKISLCLLC